MKKENASPPVGVDAVVMPSWMKIGRKYYRIRESTQTTNMLALIHKKIFAGDNLDNSLLASGNYFRNKQEAIFIFKAFHGKF